MNNYCQSSYLAFRYITKPHIGWDNSWVPEFPITDDVGIYKVKSSEEINEKLTRIFKEIYSKHSYERVAILLSSGIDSAILSTYLKKGSHAYTISFSAKNAIDESVHARKICEYIGLNHHVIKIKWADYLENLNLLMKHKKSPLHPAEISIYLAAKKAVADGHDILIVGNGADSTFGGLDKLLSKDWKYDEFTKRYTFVDPKLVLKHPVDVSNVYSPYKYEDGIDVQGFLKTVHGMGVIQMFNNAISTAGATMLCPYEEFSLGISLDINRIRSGEPKYMLRELYDKLLSSIPPLSKIPFARPMDAWLKTWKGPSHSEFLEDLNINSFSGEQKWLIFCLESFLNLIDENNHHYEK